MKNDKRYERNKVSKNISFIENLCKIKGIKRFAFVQSENGDLNVNIRYNLKDWLLCVSQDGRIVRYDKNTNRSKGWHTDRTFSNWEQAIDSCSTTHNTKYMGGLDWMDKLLNKNKK